MLFNKLKQVNLRLEAGHFEIDTVILTREKNNCLLTLVDRKTRQTIIRFIEDKTTISVNKSIQELLKEYEIKSITADNVVSLQDYQKYLIKI